jgi:asparagine synthase (glutamine-hydrolysing)
MCGIAGIINVAGALPPPDRALALAMARALRHRGPDGFGCYRDERVALAHARLAIIDRDTGWQPMGASERWICFNGEIFNYLELRRELEGKGHRFRTHSDTEVLLHCYLEHDTALFDRLNGQFAFAIWDAPRRRVVFARDRTGILPLFYCVHDGRLRFASEVKALFVDPAVPRALAPAGVEEALTFWSALAPLTPFEGVRQLPPGAVAVVDLDADGEPRVISRWQASFPTERPARGDEDEAAERLLAALEASATIRLRADVPVGSYLSGGLDSTLVAALVARRGDVPLRTFSLRFEDREFDETEFQRIATERLGTDHSAVTCSDAHIAAVFPDVVWHAEAPLLRTAPAPLLLLSRLVRESGFRVVLTGEGADEIFAGYDVFQLDKVRRFWARHPASASRPRLLLRLYPYLARSPVAQLEMAKAFFGKNLAATDDPFYALRPRWDTTARIQLMLAPPFRGAGEAIDNLRARLPADFARWSPLARAQWLEMETLLSAYLLSSQGDRMLMASSVEGRFPFLDPALIDLAAGLRDDHKLRALDEKHLLKRAARALVPSEVARRPKQPYRAPVARPFFAERPPAWIGECLAPAAVAAAGVWQPAAVEALVAKCRRSGGERMSNSDDMALCAVLSTQLLHRDMIAGARLATPSADGGDRLGVDVDRLRDAPERPC